MRNNRFQLTVFALRTLGGQPAYVLLPVSTIARNEMFGADMFLREKKKFYCLMPDSGSELLNHLLGLMELLNSDLAKRSVIKKEEAA